MIKIVNQCTGVHLRITHIAYGSQSRVGSVCSLRGFKVTQRVLRPTMIPEPKYLSHLDPSQK